MIDKEEIAIIDENLLEYWKFLNEMMVMLLPFRQGLTRFKWYLF